MYGKHPGGHKQTGIALSWKGVDGGWYNPMLGGWHGYLHANLIPELLQLGAMLWLGIMTKKKSPGTVRGAP